MVNWGAVPAGVVIPFPFTTYGKTNGESITLTGLAATDIEVYKGVSMTQRASDAGYTLLDTDGIDIDGVTGFHGFSIDTSDNTDASFYAAGSFYTVLVSTVTIDSQTVSFIAGTFRLVAAESSAGVPKVDVSHNAGTAITSAAGIQEVKVASLAANAITATAIAADAITDAKVASDVTIASVTGAVGSVTGNVGGNVVGSVGSLTGHTNQTGDAYAIVNSVTHGNAALKTLIDAIDDFLDTEIAAILAAVDTEVGAIKTKTDSLTFTVAGQVDANMLKINGTTVNGDGGVTPWGP